MLVDNPTATAVDVTVAADTETIKTRLNEFVTAYNELNNYLRTQTAYNAETRKGGTLQGDQSAVSLQNQLRLVLNQASTAPGTWSQLSQVGVTMAKDGTLSVDSTKLDAALVNLPELEKLFSGDGADTGSTGFIRRYKEMADAALSIDGTFTTRKDGLQKNSLKDMHTIVDKEQALYWALQLMKVDGIMHTDEIAFCKTVAFRLKFLPEVVDAYKNKELPEFTIFKKEVDVYRNFSVRD